MVGCLARTESSTPMRLRPASSWMPSRSTEISVVFFAFEELQTLVEQGVQKLIAVRTHFLAQLLVRSVPARPGCLERAFSDLGQPHSCGPPVLPLNDLYEARFDESEHGARDRRRLHSHPLCKVVELAGTSLVDEDKQAVLAAAQA